MKLRILDLCAGTGSATQAFIDRGHDVETLDIEGDHTYVCDVRDFTPEKKYDFIWASPPCTEFSIANSKKGACKDRKPDLSIVRACLKLCGGASYWILENPRGCLRYFIGKPQVTVKYSDYGYCCHKPTDLWGCFPWFWSATKRKIIEKGAFQRDKQGKKNRASIPYGLSLAVCKAIESCYFVEEDNLEHLLSKL